MLRIRIRKAGQREPAFSLNIPFALADLALSAMDEDDKAAIRKKGYDITKIITELSSPRRASCASPATTARSSRSGSISKPERGEPP